MRFTPQAIIANEPVRNSLCRALGHDWSATTAGNYRRCQRPHCHAVQRLAQGRWVMVTRPQAQQPAHPVGNEPEPLHAPQSEQATLWDGDVSLVSPGTMS